MDERRRQRRQQRILEAGQSRLSKITGNEYLDKTPAVKPVRQQEPQEPSVFQRRNSTDDPSEELGAPEPINVLDHMLNESLLQQFSSSPFTNISNSNEQQQQQQQTVVVADYSRYWNLLHLVLMTFLAVYAVYKEKIVMGEELFSSLLSKETHIYSSAYTPFFWYFALLELGLLSARFLLQKDQMTSNNSILATIASQLPHPYNQVINLFMRYRLIGTLFIQDIFILVFVTGLSIICMK